MSNTIVKTVKLGSRCQMVLPADIRKKLNLSEGDEIIIKARKNTAVIKLKPKNYADHLFGLHREVWKGVDPNKHIREERKKWDKDS